jgi:hypothetical protein
VILLADYAAARRRRARRFWGTMGVVLRFEDRRTIRPDGVPQLAAARSRAVRKTAFETRAPR